jgi:hypothetical protein
MESAKSEIDEESN